MTTSLDTNVDEIDVGEEDSYTQENSSKKDISQRILITQAYYDSIADKKNKHEIVLNSSKTL